MGSDQQGLALTALPTCPAARVYRQCLRSASRAGRPDDMDLRAALRDYLQQAFRDDRFADDPSFVRDKLDWATAQCQFRMSRRKLTRLANELAEMYDARERQLHAAEEREHRLISQRHEHAYGRRFVHVS